MSERAFRFILGATLLVLLYFGFDQAILAYIGIVLFEGATNLRIPLLVSRARYGAATTADVISPECAKIPFDAERMLRVIVAVLLIFTFVLYREVAWFFPWFIGVMLLVAGITNICPMVIGLRWAGFR
jgi:F0F1-type ATP synthase assembly protein I